MAFPSLTKTWHTKPYAAISPARPELSTAGKTVLITGGGSGIGHMFARSFAASGAATIILIGRTKATLIATQADLLETFSSSKVYTFPVDISDAKALNKAVAQLVDILAKAGQSPTIDILVANAAYMHNRYSLGTADEEDWWKVFTVNVLGNFNLIRAFLPHAARDAVVLHVSSGADHVPYVPGLSGYASSKLAATKVFDYLAVENPGLHVRQFHPGAVETTEQGVKSGVKGEDDPEFVGNFAVWLASKEADFLDGKMVWSNWDVDELKAMADKISAQGSPNLTHGLIGWPNLLG